MTTELTLIKLLLLSAAHTEADLAPLLDHTINTSPLKLKVALSTGEGTKDGTEEERRRHWRCCE